MPFLMLLYIKFYIDFPVFPDFHFHRNVIKKFSCSKIISILINTYNGSILSVTVALILTTDTLNQVSLGL